MKMTITALFTTALTSAALAGDGGPLLVVTEIWPGGIDGDENTSDWFEIINLGTTPIIDLENHHFRDAPVPVGVPDGLPLAGGQLTGVTTLEPGESAVFLCNWDDPIGNNPSPDLTFALNAFRAMWGEDYVAGIKLGWAIDANGGGGPGLSRNGDNVIIYNGPVTGSAVVATESYAESMFDSFIYNPMTGVFGELAVDGVFGAREGLLPAGTGTAEAYVASPGLIDGQSMTCAGDCDESGAVDFADLVSMLSLFGNTGTTGCDADGSGDVSFGDLVTALGLFGPCP